MVQDIPIIDSKELEEVELRHLSGNHYYLEFIKNKEETIRYRIKLEKNNGSVTFLYAVVGKGTREYVTLQKGDSVYWGQEWYSSFGYDKYVYVKDVNYIQIAGKERKVMTVETRGIVFSGDVDCPFLRRRGNVQFGIVCHFYSGGGYFCS